MDHIKVKVLSGVFNVRPKTALTLSAGGMIKLTPKKCYKAFRTDYRIPNQSGESIMIIKDGYRWFPVNITYATNNFEYLTDQVPMQEFFTRFKRFNEHIRNNQLRLELDNIKD